MPHSVWEGDSCLLIRFVYFYQNCSKVNTLSIRYFEYVGTSKDYSECDSSPQSWCYPSSQSSRHPSFESSREPSFESSRDSSFHPGVSPRRSTRRGIPNRRFDGFGMLIHHTCHNNNFCCQWFIMAAGCPICFEDAFVEPVSLSSGHLFVFPTLWPVTQPGTASYELEVDALSKVLHSLSHCYPLILVVLFTLLIEHDRVAMHGQE